MIFNPAHRHRRSIRLRGYDYSQAGSYFVTICTQNRARLFGDIVDGELRLNDAGKMIERWYAELENKFPDVQCDAFVCMPNHVHFVVVIVGVIVGADLRVCPTDFKSDEHGTDGTGTGGTGMDGTGTGGTGTGGTGTDGTGMDGTGTSLHHIVQWFKTMTTNEYIRGVKTQQWPPFNKKLWQRNYWERVIRNDKSLHRIRLYIMNNPRRWTADSLHRTIHIER